MALPAVTETLGTALGFYFGSQSKKGSLWIGFPWINFSAAERKVVGLRPSLPPELPLGHREGGTRQAAVLCVVCRFCSSVFSGAVGAGVADFDPAGDGKGLMVVECDPHACRYRRT